MDFDDTTEIALFNKKRPPSKPRDSFCCLKVPEWLALFLNYVLPPIIYFISDVFDLISDAVVAIKLYPYGGGSYWAFGLTVAFIFMPSLLFGVYAITSVILTENQSCSRKLTRIGIYTLAVFTLSMWPIISFSKMLYYGIKSMISRNRREEFIERYEETSRDGDLTTQRILRAFVESAPQLLLQLYLIMREPIDFQSITTITAQMCSIFFSLVSLTNTVVQFYNEEERERSIADGGDKSINKLNSKACCFLTEYLWWFLSISARVSALALFASVFHFWVFAVCFGHVSIMITCIMVNQTHRGCKEFVVSIWVGIIYIFCFVEYKGNFSNIRKAISLYIVYYAFTIPQNATMVLCSYFLTKDRYDYHYSFVIAHFLASSLSLIFMICYLGLLRPMLTVKKVTVVRTTIG